MFDFISLLVVYGSRLYYIENQERLEMNISWQCIENLI